MALVFEKDLRFTEPKDVALACGQRLLSKIRARLARTELLSVGTLTVHNTVIYAVGKRGQQRAL